MNTPGFSIYKALRLSVLLIFTLTVLSSCDSTDFTGSFMNRVASPTGESQTNFGGSVSLSGDYAIVGAPGENNHSGAGYIFKRNFGRWVQQQKIFGSDGTPGQDFFGTSVSIDGNHAIVGSWWDDTYGNNDGAAYIFQREGTGWQEAAVLLPDNADSEFGNSVAISGDYAVAGASKHKISGNQVGAVYVFKRNGIQWIKQTILTPSYPIPGAAFGSSVAIDGDYVIVGAENYENKGKAFIYERNGSDWRLVSSFNGTTNSYFGHSVSINGLFAMVGARDENNEKGSMAGAAYIYKRTVTGPAPQWIQVSKFMAQDGASNDLLGSSVSMYARSELGGYAIAGARTDDNAQGESVGAAYVLMTIEGNWIQLNKLLPSSDSDGSNYGSAVFINDGYAVIGAPGAENGTGAVYFYD